ncbi:MAG TPA: hypothetical protein DCG75_15995 [Bacteroidales bacterium]|nr:hypothetical protein [Bacteroidales bacterium]
MTNFKFHNRTFILLVILSFVVPSIIKAQQNNTFYLMHDVPQSKLLNPAVQIKCKWFVGFPLLTSTQLNYSNSTFSFNELFTTSNGSASLDIGTFYNNIKKTNLLSTELHLDLISVGYRFSDYYVNFNIAEKINIGLTYPGSIMDLAWKGNTQFLGETVEFNNLRTHSVYYREYSLGVSKVWDAYNIFGIRAKLLFGKANIYSGKSEMSLYTDPNTFDLHVEGDINVNTSFPITITQNSDGKINGSEMGDIDIVSFLMNGKNKGFALDLGWIYKFSENITLSASLLDLGFIRWKSDVNNIQISGSFDYTGTGLGSNFSSTDYMTQLSDSIADAFNQTVTQDNYYSWLPTQIYLGGMYQYRPKLGIGAVSRNVIYRNKLHSSFTLSANTTIWNKFSASLSWSYLNNTYKNIGLGLAWHSRGLQFHMISDNVLGIIKPLDTRTLNLRFGFSFLFGCPKNKEEEQKMSNPYNSQNNGNCFWAKKMDKNYKDFLKKKKKNNRK